MRRALVTTVGSVIALALISTAAAAQTAGEPVAEAAVIAAGSPFSPINDRIISDPLYLPAKGRFYGATGYSLGVPVSSTYNNAGVKRSEHTAHDNSVSQTLAYGITRTLSVHLSLSYEWDANDSTAESTGVTSTGNSRGLNDPDVGVTYRAVQQSRGNPVNVDFTVNYAPNVIASNTGGVPKGGGARIVGSASAGRDTVVLAAGVGRAMRDFTVQGSVSATHVGVRNYSSVASGDLFRQDSAWAYNLSLRTQTRFSRRFSVNANLTYSFAGDRGGANKTTGLTWTVQEPTNVSVGVGANYHLIPNKLVASLNYGHNFRGDSAVIYPNPSSNVLTRDAFSNSMSIRLQYALN